MSSNSPSDLPGDQAQAAFAKPEELRPVNLRALTPFQRALLVIDGTVTKFIEAYTLEPVKVVTLAQGPWSPDEAEQWGALAEDSDEPGKVLKREVIIEGRYSGLLYVYALSYIMADRLPEALRGRIGLQGEGIGRLLEELGVESRREVLWFGRERTEKVPDVVRDNGHREFVTRAYRIIMEGKPLVLITERFPLSAQPAFRP